jgi:hypothetical protein
MITLRRIAILLLALAASRPLAAQGDPRIQVPLWSEELRRLLDPSRS